MPKHKKTPSRPKTLYRVKNWSEYDQALVQRGSLTFWWCDDFEKTWLYVGEKQRSSQFDYSDQAIRLMLTVKEIFHLTNRGVEGFMRSIFQFRRRALDTVDGDADHPSLDPLRGIEQNDTRGDAPKLQSCITRYFYSTSAPTVRFMHQSHSEVSEYDSDLTLNFRSQGRLLNR